MPHPGNSRRRASKHFFVREDDGTVRVRIRFDSVEASLMEEAAGSTPVMEWLQLALHDAARRTVHAKREASEAHANIPPPQVDGIDA